MLAISANNERFRMTFLSSSQQMADTDQNLKERPVKGQIG